MSDDDILLIRRKDAAKKSRERAERAVVVIPPCADKDRRLLLESDDIEWLEWYFGHGCGLEDPFTYSFTNQQRRMIKAIRDAITFGGDQALAASRGEGKTTLAERLVLKCTLSGELNYTVLFASTAGMADNLLDSIKTAIIDNERLAADYPEVCYPVRSLEGAPQKANTQRVNGERFDNGEFYEMAETRFSWCGQEVILPTVPGSPSSGAIIATRGLDSAVRGLKKRGKRPKLAIIDDPDTEDTARSEEQSKKLETRIDRAIGGLGGQQRGIGRVMLTTLQSRLSVSYTFTDLASKPTWKGERFRYLVHPPHRPELWQEYIQLYLSEIQDKDDTGTIINPHGRRSHAMYLANRASMDEGAIVANPNRFNGEILPDGSQVEVSSLQHYYNLIARLGPDAVAAEYDNDPPEETGPVASGISAALIQRQLSGLPMARIPDGCTVLTQGVDVGKWLLHWVVRAWKPDGTGYVIDYGRQDVGGALKYKSDLGLDKAIRNAVMRRIDEFRNATYAFADGSQIASAHHLTLVDAGYRTDAVYAACASSGLGVYPVMGFGKSLGCVKPSFTNAKHRTAVVIPGDNWKLAKNGNIWLCEAYADHWKAWEHDRWMTSTDKPGCLSMWGEHDEDRTRMSPDERSHTSYAHHICAEVEVEEPFKGGLRRRWKPVSKENHWLDASYYSDVAASIKGIRLTGPVTAKIPQAIPGVQGSKRTRPEDRPSLADLASR